MIALQQRWRQEAKSKPQPVLVPVSAPITLCRQAARRDLCEVPCLPSSPDWPPPTCHNITFECVAGLWGHWGAEPAASPNPSRAAGTAARQGQSAAPTRRCPNGAYWRGCTARNMGNSDRQNHSKDGTSRMACWCIS